MRRVLHGSIAKRGAFDTAQYRCPVCEREIVLFGRSQDRSKLRTPKCETTPMEQVHYAENVKEPRPEFVTQLNSCGKPWTRVHMVKGDKTKHKVRPEGASPELADRGYAYAGSEVGEVMRRRAIQEEQVAREAQQSLQNEQVDLRRLINGGQTPSRDAAGRGNRTRTFDQFTELAAGESLSDLLGRAMRDAGRVLAPGRNRR